MAVTGADLIGLYKIWYTDKEMESLLFRNSPLARMLKKVRIGGRQYNFPALFGRGGACAGDMTVAATNASNAQAKVAEYGVTFGQMFSVFAITQQEILASMNPKGAYAPAAVVKMYAALESFRKLFATSLYGSGFGEIGVTGSTPTLIVGSNTVDFADVSLVVKLDIGSVFRVVNGATPSGTLRTSVNTVTAIDGTSVTFTATATDTWVATDVVVIEGCRSGSTPLLPVGLAGWIPSIANRTGGTWTTYIGTAFFGVDRSVAPNRLAGQFILRNTGASEKYADAIIRGIQAVRTAGGTPKMIVVSSTIFAKLASEMNAQTTLFQNINTGSDSKKKNEVAKGISDMSFMFSTSWLQYTIEDPYCPQYLGYILDEDTIEFACLSNVDTPINDGIAGQDPGVQAVNGAPDVTQQYRFILDDYLTVNPGTNTVGGPAEQVSLNMYGNWVFRAPGHCAVLNFVS